MPKNRAHTERRPTFSGEPARTSKLTSIPADAALSFLKDTKGAVTWSVRDVADTLKISRSDAEQVVALLAAQGYVQAKGNEWMTTSSGETVAGAKTSRFAPEGIKQALAVLRERIKEANHNSRTEYTITDALAFGDFLLKDRARVQAADVGIGLSRRGREAHDLRSASDAKTERAFLRRLRGKTLLLNLRPYAEWMRKRSNLDLL
jgi:hypothetical protein